LVKPLKLRALAEIIERTGWTSAYARGVLQAWKMRAAYCEAVLRENLRVNLNGEPLPETIDEKAREQTRKQLAVIAARKKTTGKAQSCVALRLRCAPLAHKFF
jgi:sRNA-binding protein